MDNNKEIIHGYEIKRSIAFDNNRGFALAENPNAVSPFVTWQFTEDENGHREYYWGHYTSSSEAAARDYGLRIAKYQKDHGVAEKDAIECKSHAGRKKPIAEQIKEGAQKAAHDNATHPAPEITVDKDR